MGSVQFAFDNMIARIVRMWGQMDFDWFSLDALSSTGLLILQVVLCICGFIPFIALATTYLLLAKFMVGLLLIIGPLFIMMAFFPVTRSLFQAWSGQCFNYILLSILYPISFSFFAKILDLMFESEISLANSFFLCIVFLVMNASSTQIPVLTSGLSGGVGINGLTGGGMGGALMMAGKAALGILKAPKKLKNFIAEQAKNKIKAG